ncbi:4-(cytidine 5'-diphospho)-2-C-methyl-D-erythritol kinase [Lentibacillus sp. N15]|uniref:4-(cytidine 5'-diphospho)-2-C-methyl-D-erythritol kinase n=1 Tax=Lentibacillus songyuanensis TaxID=3136161 RepID=UPI0031BB220C
MIHFERAPAKINLSLDVLRKREDGFHEVAMIMTAIDLVDRIELHPLAEDRIEVAADNQYVPNNERNLAYKAAAILKDKYHVREGVRIKIEKNIPVSAGLGGGSSDAAAVLRGLNQMWSINNSLKELASIGEEIGSDVPFCVYSTTALATGHGERIQELSSPPSCYVVLAKPNIGVSTRGVFQRVDLSEIIHPNTNEVLTAIEQADFGSLAANIGNALESITFRLHPEVEQIKKKMIQSGANGVLMSGSGPTIVGLVEHYSKARRIYNGLRGFCEEVYIVRLLDQRRP